MGLDWSATRVQRDIRRLSHAGLDSGKLLAEALARLRRVVPVDAYWAATVDPATILFTGSVVDGIPAEATPLFLANEFLGDDVNQFTTLARGPAPVRSLYAATGGMPASSQRFRDIMAPIGLGDELRVAMRVGGTCWGVLCLHRELAPSGFSEEEARFLLDLAPHLAEGLRAAVLLGTTDLSVAADGPGLLLLADDLSLVAMTPSAQTLLGDVAHPRALQELPQAVLAVAARLRQLERDPEARTDLMPRVRLRSPSGRWLIAHASRVARREPGGQIAVIIEVARPVEVAPLLLAAYAFTPRELEVGRLVLAGQSTEAIAAAMVISPLTVQQHLKAMFEKVGVRSRRELVARVFAEQYAPHLHQDTPVGPDGGFGVTAKG
jgi:DNA-binding CsgD family transcriptional regulator